MARKTRLGIVSVAALGVAATTTMVALIVGLVPGAIPPNDRSRIIFVRGAQAAPDGLALPYWRNARQLEDLSLFEDGGANFNSTAWSGDVLAAAVSADFFHLLRPALSSGRLLSGGPGEALVSSEMAGRGIALGQKIAVNGKSLIVVGTLSPGFAIPAGAQVWIPLAPNENPGFGPAPSGVRAIPGDVFTLVARVQDASTTAAAEAELNAMFDRMQRIQIRNGFSRALPLEFQSLASYLYAAAPPELPLIVVATGLLMLCCLAAVAALFASWYEHRRHELAVRSVLGAPPRALLRLMLGDASACAASGAAIGIAGSVPVLHLIRLGWLGDLRTLPSIRLNASAGLAGAGVGLSVLLLGAAFAWLAASKFGPHCQPLSDRLRNPPRATLARALIVAQAASSMALLCICAALATQYWNSATASPGFALNNVYYLNLPASTDSASVASLLRKLRANEPPAWFAVASGVPLADLSRGGRDVATLSGIDRVARIRMISGGYFQTLGIPVLAGTDLTASGPAAVPPCIVSRSLANLLWGNRNPLGERASVNGNAEYEVVGEVGDVRDRGLGFPPVPMLYIPIASTTTGPKNLVALFRPRPSVPAAAVSQYIHSHIAAAQPTPLSELAERERIEPRTQLVLLAGLGIWALALALASLWAMISSAVVSRTRELGIRLALGASPRQLPFLLLREAAFLALIATPIGLLLSLWVRSLVSAAVIEVRPIGQGPSIVMALATALAMLATASIPAWRASRADVATVLRQDY